jgi:hypothetical protein
MTFIVYEPSDGRIDTGATRSVCLNSSHGVSAIVKIWTVAGESEEGGTMVGLLECEAQRDAVIKKKAPLTLGPLCKVTS